MIGKIDDKEDYKALESANKVNISAAFGQTSGSATGKLNYSKGFRSVQWKTIIYNNIKKTERELFFAELPSRTNTVELLSRNASQINVRSEGNALFAASLPHTHSFEILGYSDFLTNKENWILGTHNFDDVYEELPVIDVKPVTNSQNETIGAQFRVTGIPKPSYFPTDLTQRAGSIRLTYSLNSKVRLDGRSITISVDKAISTSSHPIPYVDNFLPVQLNGITMVDGRTIFNAQWEAIVNFTDTENPVKKANQTSAILVDKATIRFADGSTRQVEAHLVYEGSSYKLKIISSSNEFKNGIDFAAPKRSVTFEALYSIPLASSGSTRKLLKTTLEYPVENKPAVITVVEPVATVN